MLKQVQHDDFDIVLSKRLNCYKKYLLTLRLPAGTIDRLKIRAHKMDIPYQSLIKQMIFEGLAK